MGQKQDWEDLATLDPLWAILSDPHRRFGQWDASEFFASGEAEVGRLLQRVAMLGLPANRKRALDFGCGVGRLTRAMSRVFEECYGVDISEGMIVDLARQYNHDRPNCRFVVNTAPHLRMFPDGHCDLIYSSITLQHILQRRQILGYIDEFLRVLAVGGLLAFQLPSHLPLRHRLQPRRRLYALFRRLGFDPRFLYARLGLYPVGITSVPEAQIIDVVQSRGGRVLEVAREQIGNPAMESCTYFIGR